MPGGVLVKAAGRYLEDTRDPISVQDLRPTRKTDWHTSRTERQLHLNSHMYLARQVCGGYSAPSGQAPSARGVQQASEAGITQRTSGNLENDKQAAKRSIQHRIFKLDATSCAAAAAPQGGGRRPPGVLLAPLSLGPTGAPAAAREPSGQSRPLPDDVVRGVADIFASAAAPVTVPELAYAVECNAWCKDDSDKALAADMLGLGAEGVAGLLSDPEKRGQAAEMIVARIGSALRADSAADCSIIPGAGFGRASAGGIFGEQTSSELAGMPVERLNQIQRQDSDPLVVIRQAVDAIRHACRAAEPSSLPPPARWSSMQPHSSRHDPLYNVALRCLDWRRPRLQYDVSAPVLGAADSDQVTLQCIVCF